jgi:hypothetical protein
MGSGCTNLKKKEKRISELRYLATKRTYRIDRKYTVLHQMENA